MLWMFIFPPRGERMAPTITGVLLIVVSLGIGTAAYNTSNNILFITLSLLLSCLVLSGALSWLNLRGTAWRLHAGGAWRAGVGRPVGLELRNAKGVLPTYGLWFDLAAGAAKERRHLEARLDPGETTRLEWTAKAERRGRMRVELRGVGSLYPFGFLRKGIASSLGTDVLVWPAAVEYRREGEGAAWLTARGRERVNRPGHDGDLMALRRYAAGDPPRQVHWKASARLGHLMVRQLAADGLEGYTLRLEADADVWTRPEQFELAVGLAATLAEDLFRIERLQAVAINDGPAQTVLRRRDVDAFLDRLAVLAPEARGPGAGRARASEADRRRVITIEPQGPRGVAAMLNGKTAASA